MIIAHDRKAMKRLSYTAGALITMASVAYATDHPDGSVFKPVAVTAEQYNQLICYGRFPGQTSADIGRQSTPDERCTHTEPIPTDAVVDTVRTLCKASLSDCDIP